MARRLWRLCKLRPAGGFVASLARPGGNITGFIAIEPPLAGKWPELLKELAPRIRRVAFLFNPDDGYWAEPLIHYARIAAAANAVELTLAAVHDDAEIDDVLAALARSDGGLMTLADDFTTDHRKEIIALGARYHLPAIYSNRSFTNDGGMMSCGISWVEMFRLAAGYVDRILKGEKPAGLPVQAPTKYELVVNLKTAKALGIEVPSSILVRADEVIKTAGVHRSAWRRGSLAAGGAGAATRKVGDHRLSRHRPPPLGPL